VSGGLTHDARHRYFWEGKGPIPSVTTILSTLGKGGLVPWAIGLTAEAAVRKRDMWLPTVDIGEDAAIAALKTVANSVRDDAASMGTRIHTLAEQVFVGTAVEATDGERPFIRQLERFLADWKPEFVRLEAQVCSLTHDYAGTLDFIARIGGRLVIGDIKTSKGVYAETAAQLVAYANADFMGWPDDATKYPIPKVDGHVVLHVRPDGYELIPMDVAGAWEAFLGLRTVYGWLQAGAKKAVGAPLTPSMEVAA
jgi:hypothetical protein